MKSILTLLALCVGLALPTASFASASLDPTPSLLLQDPPAEDGGDAEASEGEAGEGEAAADQDGAAEEADGVSAAADAAAKELEEATKDPVGFAKKWLNKGKTWLTEEGPKLAGKIVLFLVLLVVSKLLANIAGGIVRKATSSSKLKFSSLLKEFLVGTTRKVIFFLGLLFAAAAVGINVGPFLAAFGVVGFVIGFAMQDTMSNFASGFMLLLYRPFDVGDFVEAGGVTGVVEAMSLVSTTMRTPDNKGIVVPNSSIFGATITNYNAKPTRRVDLTAGIGYGDDIAKAQKVLERICAEHPKVLDEPKTQIEVSELGDSSVNFVVRPWANAADYWAVYFDLTRSIKLEFDKEGISIPFPQRDVHLYKQGD